MRVENKEIFVIEKIGFLGSLMIVEAYDKMNVSL